VEIAQHIWVNVLLHIFTFEVLHQRPLIIKNQEAVARLLISFGEFSYVQLFEVFVQANELNLVTKADWNVLEVLCVLFRALEVA
jgi:hypothetical protein